MLILLFCLVHAFLPDLVTLIRDAQIHAAVLALAVFGFIVLRLRRLAALDRSVVS